MHLYMETFFHYFLFINMTILFFVVVYYVLDKTKPGTEMPGCCYIFLLN